MIGIDKTNFPNNLLLPNKQAASLFKALRTELSKIIPSSGFLGRLHRPSMKIGLSFMKNVLAPLAKSVMIRLGLAAATSATASRIHEKI